LAYREGKINLNKENHFLVATLVGVDVLHDDDDDDDCWTFPTHACEESTNAFSPPLLLSSSPPLLLSSSRPVQLSEAEWYAETYSVRSEPHFALLLFWVHTEVMRRAVSMAYRQALLRARRLQFKAYQSDIVNLLKATKMEDR
jgi:hypothetical protein